MLIAFQTFSHLIYFDLPFTNEIRKKNDMETTVT